MGGDSLGNSETPSLAYNMVELDLTRRCAYYHHILRTQSLYGLSIKTVPFPNYSSPSAYGIKRHIC